MYVYIQKYIPLNLDKLFKYLGTYRPLKYPLKGCSENLTHYFKMIHNV